MAFMVACQCQHSVEHLQASTEVLGQRHQNIKEEEAELLCLKDSIKEVQADPQQQGTSAVKACRVPYILHPS